MHPKHSATPLGAKSFTSTCAELYFSRDVGGYFSLSFTVTIPGMITPATM